ncbi:MAG: glycosyltransferase family 39 protein [bacterium]
MSAAAPGSGHWTPPGWLTAAVIAFGALLRWAAVQQELAISVDSVRYLTFASNWLHGIYGTWGPTGLREFPDLGLPLCTTFVMPSAGDPIRSAQLVSWGAGIGILILVARIARRLYGPTVAFYATFLAAVSQPLIVASGQVQTESLYCFWSLLALDATLSALERPSTASGLMIGFACAMGYLTRGVGIVLLPLAAILLYVGARRGIAGPEVPLATLEDPIRQSIALQAYQVSLQNAWPVCIVAIILSWLAPVGAYQTMLYATYGRVVLSDQAIWHVGGPGASSDDVRLEGKLTDDGSDYALNAWFRAHPGGGGSGLDLGGAISRWLHNEVGIVYYIPEELLEPLTLILIALGLLSAIAPPRWPYASAILAWWMVPYLVLQPFLFTIARYLFPVIPLLLVFGGRGVVMLQEWAMGLALRRNPKAPATDLGAAERWVFAALFVLYLPSMIWPLTHVEPRYQNLEAKAAGEWLAAHEVHDGIFATSPVAGYYAGIDQKHNLVLPDADLNTILRFAAQKEVHWILLEERRVPTTRPPELTALLYCAPEALPASVLWRADITTWPGYRVRILEIKTAGLAKLEVPR